MAKLLYKYMEQFNPTNLPKYSPQKVHVVCKTCHKKFTMCHRSAYDNYARNHESIICNPCAKSHKYTGNNNPNARYQYDHHMLSSVDTEAKAYLLGWITSDGSLDKNKIQIVVHKKDEEILHKLKTIVCPDIPIWSKQCDFRGIRICSKIMVTDVCHLLNIGRHKKSHIVQMPNLDNEQLVAAFVRGVFDGDGSIKSHFSYSLYPQCIIRTNSEMMRISIHQYFDGYISKNGISWSGLAAMTFLKQIYSNSTLHLERKYQAYLSWRDWSPKTIHTKIKPTNNTSGYIGVHYHKKSQKWAAVIGKDRKQHHLGLFDSKEQAFQARKTAETRYYGEPICKHL